MAVSKPVSLAAFEPLLEALDGIAYITDFRGDFLAWGKHHWRRFAAENRADGLEDPLGRNTLASCSDPDTAGAYRQIYGAFEAGQLDSYSFGFRCDSPRVRRELRMSLNTLVLEDRRVGIIHQSTILSEAERPMVGLLEHPLPSGREDKAVILMCSYCLRIWDTPGWIEPEAYYRKGGSAEVAVSHGICPDCRERILEPVLRLN